LCMVNQDIQSRTSASKLAVNDECGDLPVVSPYHAVQGVERQLRDVVHIGPHRETSIGAGQGPARERHSAHRMRLDLQLCATRLVRRVDPNLPLARDGSSRATLSNWLTRHE